MPRQYSPEFRQPALRLLKTRMEASDISEFEAIISVASKLGMSVESLRRTTSQEHAEIRPLKRELVETRRAICNRARPPRDEIIACIDTHRDQFGVELIRRVSRAAITEFRTSRGYRAAKTRPARDREIRNEQSIADRLAAHEKNYSCYRVLKMHQAMKRPGWRLGREQTRRLMRKAGLRGVQRGKPVLTTITDPTEQRPADLVNPAIRGGHPETGYGWPTSPLCAPGRDSATRQIAAIYLRVPNESIRGI